MNPTEALEMTKNMCSQGYTSAGNIIQMFILVYQRVFRSDHFKPHKNCSI